MLQLRERTCDDRVGFQMSLARNRHRTTSSRLLRPISSALADGLIDTDTTAFVCGCALGDYLHHLRRMSIRRCGRDPIHHSGRTCALLQAADLGCVVNLVEDLEERKSCLTQVQSHSEKVLIISVCRVSQSRDFTYRYPLRLGTVPKRAGVHRQITHGCLPVRCSQTWPETDGGLRIHGPCPKQSGKFDSVGASVHGTIA